MDYVRSGARLTYAFDILVALAWSGVAIAILATDCWETMFVLHVLIFLHFGVQTVAIATLLEDINRYEWEEEHGQAHEPVRPPIAWATATAITLVGDIFILSYDVLHFRHMHSDEACYSLSAGQLGVDAANAFVATCSLICYLVAVYHIKKRRPAAADAIPLNPVPTTVVYKGPVTSDNFW